MCIDYAAIYSLHAPWLACLYVYCSLCVVYKNYSILHLKYRKRQTFHRSQNGRFLLLAVFASVPSTYFLHRHTRCQSGPRNSYLPIWPLRRDAAFVDRMLEAPRSSRPFFLDEERRAEDLRERPVALVRLLAKKMRADPPSTRPTIA